MEELLPHGDATYRTTATREGRILEGFSRRGFAAAHLAFKHPNTFGAISLLAGAFHTADELPRLCPSLFQDYFGGNHQRWQQENAFDLAVRYAETHNAAALPMRMLVGTDDPGQYPGNLRYHQHLLSLGFNCPLTSIPGVDHTVRGIYDHTPSNPFAFFEQVAAKIG